MKKFLLTTTALVGFAASAQAGGGHMPAEATPAPANTGGITVMVGGNLSFEAGIADQDNNASVNDNSTGADVAGTAGNTRDTHFTNPNTEIHITAAGSAENFDYGAVVELNADVNGDVEGDGGNADKTYLFAESDNFGRVELGANQGAEGTLEIDASNIARATGGIDGNWWHYVDTNGVDTTAGTDNSGSSFNLTPNLIVDDADATTSDASKITYYTPRFSGVQLGVSYVPDTGDIGSGVTLSAKNNGDYENVFAGGINYEANMDGVGLGLSAVGETGESEVAGTNDLSAYSIGGKVEVSGFSVAGNWADQGDSGLPSTSTEDKNEYWTAGAAYENGPAGVSVTYIDSQKTQGTANSDNELSNVVVGADYQLAPGFTPYVEAAFFELDDTAAGTVDNDGSVVLLGAELSF